MDNLTEKRSLELLREEFSDIDDKIEKCYQYTEINAEFCLDAFILAKAFQEKYKYRLSIEEIEKIFEKFGIVVERNSIDIVKTCMNHGVSMSSYLYLDRYAVQEALEPYTLRDSWSFTESEGHIQVKHVSEDGHGYFGYYYVFVILILFHNEIENGTRTTFYYGNRYISNIKEEKAAIIIALLLIYIHKLYSYELQWYPANSVEIGTGKIRRNLPNIHYYPFIDRTTREGIGMDIVSITYVLREKFSKEYKELLQMPAPEEQYLEYKNRDYTKFPKIDWSNF